MDNKLTTSQTMLAVLASSAIVAIAGVVVGVLSHLEETAGFKLSDVLESITKGKSKSDKTEA